MSRFRWDFKIPGCEPFDDASWDAWREPFKLFLWSLLADPPPGRKPGRHGSVFATYMRLRVFFPWMRRQGCRSPAELDRTVGRQFLAYLATRKGRRPGHGLSQTTLDSYEHDLNTLYLQGTRYPMLACDEPFPGRRPGPLGRGPGRWPYTPDEISVPLLTGALRLIGQPASDVVALYTLAQDAYDATLAAGYSGMWARKTALRTVSDFKFSTLPGDSEPWHPYPITSTKRLTWLVDRMYDAAFVLIAWLVGMRASEILGLQVGCVEHEDSLDGTETRTFLNGRIYKTASDIRGDPHRWVAPDCIERAIDVLTGLSAPLPSAHGQDRPLVDVD